MVALLFKASAYGEKSMKLMVAALVCFALFLAASAFAQPQPVTDTVLEDMTSNMRDILSNRIAPEIAQQSDSLQALNKTVQHTLSGSSGVGGLNNIATEQNFRNWTPSSADLASMVQQGLQTGSMADQINYYNQKFKIPAAAELTPGNPHNVTADYGVFSAVATNAALGVADKSFDNVAYIVQQINFLYRQLDQQQNLKQSADFNTVILLKIAALQTDLIRLEAQQLKMLGVAQQQSNSKRTFAAQFIKDIE
jgi:hypothetical protein